MNIKNLTAKLFCKNVAVYTGTAWLCSDRYVLTAAHCVADRKNPQIYKGPFRLLFPAADADDASISGKAIEVVSDEIAWLDPELDVALLAIDPMPVAHLAGEIKQLRSNSKPGNQAEEDKNWNAFGFPFGNQTGMTIDGTITDFFAKITERSTPAIQLFCNQGGFLTHYNLEGQPVQDDKSTIMALTGESGAAVVHHGEIIGIVRLAPPKLGQSVVFATPLNAIAERSQQVAEVLQQHRQNHIENILDHWLSWEATVVRPELVKDFLEDRPDVVHVESQIYNLWDQFIDDRAWHEDIANQLGQIRDSAAETKDLGWLVERIDRIDFNQTYRQIVLDFDHSFKNAHGRVKQLISELEDGLRLSLKRKDPVEIQTRYETELTHARSVNSDLYTLSREFDSPLFRRCFLITGSSGAGKTHFITQLLSTNDSDSDVEYLVLPLITPTKEGTIEDLLLSKIRVASGENDWINLDKFCALLAQRRTRDAPGSNERPLKLVVAIDDLDKWMFLRGDNFSRELTDFIASKTNVHNLFWLINYHNANYDKISGDRFWPQYAAVRALPRTDIAETKYHSPNLGGWYLLDGFNESGIVGLEIIHATHDKAEADEVDSLRTRVQLLRFVDADGPTLRNLSNPFIAWIVADLIRDEVIDWSTLDLNYVEFVSAFWKKRKQNLSSALANQSINIASVSVNELDRFVWIVAKALTQFPDLYPGRSALIREAVKLAEQFLLEHRDQESIESTIAILNQGNLLRSITKPAELGLGLPSEPQIEILIEPFWEYFIASGLIDLKTISAIDAKTIWHRLETMASRKDIREGICIFLLLLLARASADRSIADLFTELLRLGIDSNNPLGASIWFAGQKGDAEFQQKLSALAREQSLEFSEPHTLYASMAFVGDCSSQVLSPIDRLKLLKPHYRRIQEFALSEYYYFVARRITRQINSSSEARELMEVLTGCEEMDCAPQLARLTVKVLRDVFANNRKHMLDSVIGYLQELSNSNEVPTRVPGGKARPYFYRELLMHEICERIVQDCGTSQTAYNRLTGRGWYDPARTGIVEPISSEMQQQANIALGHWFRSQGDFNPGYVKLVRNLLAGTQHEKETAFYLIRHTIPMKGPQNLPVAFELRPVLRILYKDPTMSGFVEAYRQFFQVNIKRSKRTVGR